MQVGQVVAWPSADASKGTLLEVRMVIPLDQAGALPSSQSPIDAEIER